MKEIVRKYINFYIENFRRIKGPVKIPLRAITILLGPNGSGKSTFTSALQLFYFSLDEILSRPELRKKAFMRKEFYTLITSSDEEIKLREEHEKFYFEFSYCKDEDYINIKTFEYGEIKEQNVLIPIIKFDLTEDFKSFEFNLDIDNTLLKKWKAEIESIEKDEIINTLDEINEALKASYHFDLNRRELNNLEDYNIDVNFEYFREKYKNFGMNEDFEINKDLLNTLLFFEDSFHDDFQRNLFDIKDNKQFRKISLRDLGITGFQHTWYHKYASKFGVEGLLNLSFEEFFVHLIISTYIRRDIVPEIENIIFISQSFITYDETRENPPDFFELIDDKPKNDYYEVFKFFYFIHKEREGFYLDKKRGKNIEHKDYEELYSSVMRILSDFEIADKVLLKESGYKLPGTKFVEIWLEYKGKQFHIKDLSSGGKQLLPIIVGVFGVLRNAPPYNEFNSSSFILKQPELHMHPKLQMKLPDFFVEFTRKVPRTIGESWDKIYRWEFDFIIETHSEHIIRKFQLLVADPEINDFTNEDICILYFNPDENNLSSTIKIMELDEKGNFIDNWPSGFFDELADLSFALLEAQIKRQN